MARLCKAAFSLCVAALSWGLAASCVAGCGTLAADDQSAGGQSISAGAGPFQRLPSDQVRLLVEFSADLDDADVLADPGGGFTVYYTRSDEKGASIRRARFASLGASPEVDTVLVADQPGEGGGVAQPAVLAPSRAGEGWLLCYATASRTIHCATSDDGGAFPKGGFTLALPPEAGREVESPALVRLDRASVAGAAEVARLFFLAGDTLKSIDVVRTGSGWAAVTDPRTGAMVIRRVLAAGDAPWLTTLGRTTARTITTPAGRTRYDLFLSGRLPGVTGVRVIGLAASFDARAFTIASAPFLGVRLPDTWAPSVTTLDDGQNLLVFTERVGAHNVISGATSP